MRSTFSVALVLCLPIVIGGPAWGKIDYADPSIYGTPVNLGPLVNTFDVEVYPTLPADQLSLVFSRGDPSADLWMATRSSKNDPWDNLVRLGPEINSAAVDQSASLTGDGLELYIGRNVGTSFSTWLATRATQDDPWTQARELPSPDSNTDVLPRVSSDGLSLFVSGYFPGDNYLRTRASRDNAWGSPVRLPQVINTSRGETPGALSDDGLAFFFDREHGNNWQSYDVWVSQRDTLGSPWKSPILLPEPVNALGANDGNAWLSPDGTALYFSSDRPGGQGSYDLWQVPIVANILSGDYNNNGVVDATDYVVWRDTLGQLGAGLAADGNDNNEIDPGDYDIWRAHFGQTAGNGAALPSAEPLSVAVPEPATLLMFLTGMLAMLLRRRAVVPSNA